MLYDLSVFQTEDVDDRVAPGSGRAHPVHVQQDVIAVGENPQDLAVRFWKILLNPGEIFT